MQDVEIHHRNTKIQVEIKAFDIQHGFHIYVHSAMDFDISFNADFNIYSADFMSASEMTYIVSSGALNSTHSLTLQISCICSGFCGFQYLAR